jgi:hypothetical protein
MSQIAGKKHKYFYYKTFWNILSDVNTLFRSQSLASKVMYEMMKFTGQKYLIATLRPLIDLVGNNSIEKSIILIIFADLCRTKILRN